MTRDDLPLAAATRILAPLPVREVSSAERAEARLAHVARLNLTPSGLTIGVQIVGRPFAAGEVDAVGAAIGGALGGDRRPPLG